jgi:hypothetical protein
VVKLYITKSNLILIIDANQDKFKKVGDVDFVIIIKSLLQSLDLTNPIDQGEGVPSARFRVPIWIKTMRTGPSSTGVINKWRKNVTPGFR